MKMSETQKICQFHAAEKNKKTLVVEDDTYILVRPSCQHPLGLWMKAFMNGADAHRLRIDAFGICGRGLESNEYQRQLVCS